MQAGNEAQARPRCQGGIKGEGLGFGEARLDGGGSGGRRYAFSWDQVVIGWAGVEARRNAAAHRAQRWLPLLGMRYSVTAPCIKQDFHLRFDLFCLLFHQSVTIKSATANSTPPRDHVDSLQSISTVRIILLLNLRGTGEPESP